MARLLIPGREGHAGRSDRVGGAAKGPWPEVPRSVAALAGEGAPAFHGGTGSANNNWIRFDSRPTTTAQVALSLDGTMTPTSIPEPATMGLLGLGALALVIRRKLSK